MVRSFALLSVAALLLSQPAHSQAVKSGSPVGPVALTSPEGLPVTMNNYAEHKGTVVVFLSSRDPHTREQAEAIESLNQSLHRMGTLLIGVFTDPDATGSEVRAYCQAHGFNFPVYLDPDGKVAAQFGARVTPQAFLLGAKGELLYDGAVSGVLAAIPSVATATPVPSPAGALNGTPIGTRLPPQPVEERFGKIEFSSELIFDKIAGYPVHHCSSIVVAPNGDLLVSWYGGSYESSDDQVLFLARRPKGTRIWEKPEIIVRSPGKPPGNAVLFKTKDDVIWLVWGRMEGAQPMLRGKGWNKCSLFYRTSKDSGMTWSEDKPFFHDTFGWLPRNLTITLSDGTLILPLSDELHGNGVDLSFFLATKDNGATWTRSGIMRGGEQPTFVQRSDGSLLAYLRIRPNIVEAESHDGGATWTTPKPTVLKNPDSGISMTRLKNGHLLLVFNDQDNARSPLHIARSLDDGKTWSKPLQLEGNPGEYSYPSVFEAEDGKIHIIYTFRRYSIKHVEMNEGWLTDLVRPD